MTTNDSGQWDIEPELYKHAETATSSFSFWQLHMLQQETITPPLLWNVSPSVSLFSFFLQVTCGRS